MNRAHHAHPLRLVSFAALIAVAASCVSERTVYRDQSGPIPPSAAANFVGYANTATKQTVCGNCHVDIQTEWIQTGHARAWQNLVASGSMQSSCQDCHSVSANGNGATGQVGYTATKDARYQDVQCESCHGAGLTHVTNPSLGNRPLASIAVSADTTSKFGCAGCHTGTHEPFVEQWRQSAHSGVIAEPATEAGCTQCHSGQGALVAWNVTTNYIEKDATVPQPITCTVCHDPHAKNNDKQLRFGIAARDTTQNLCMKCHNRRGAVDWSSSRNSAHAPEGPTLLGYAGWFPPPMVSPDQGGAVIATHGSASNPALCATCHVARFTVNDKATGKFMFQATGHTFDATPCVDATGIPVGGTCAITQQTFQACATSGCHGSPDAARSALVTAEARIQTLITQLTAMLAKVPSSEKTGTLMTVARGALFNLSVAKSGNASSVRGAVAHNPFLIEQLLTNSIKAVQTTYGVSPAQGLVLDNILQKH